ncbi:YibE/F family protein [Pseudonocardiaceae bacterium YIM PH 21723]|nr:YibE/F family protein [Pseudonocardiaceae bacterium YIM PH 21723]
MLILALLIPLALATLAGVITLYPWSGTLTATGPSSHQTAVHGTVTDALTTTCVQGGTDQCVTLTVALADGKEPGKSVNIRPPLNNTTPRFAVGDKITLAVDDRGGQGDAQYSFVNFQRGTPMWVLLAVFVLAVLVLGRLQGGIALGALGLSLLVLILFIIPSILAGHSPLWTAIVGSSAIMFVVLYLTHGFTARTSTAVIGTVCSLGLIWGLSSAFSAAAKITGLDDETTNLITVFGHAIDARGLFLAGVIIGALGVLDDVTVTQTSAVWELRRASPDYSWRQLYTSALQIGKDHISSAVNTLVMAYAGAALPTLISLSISGNDLGDILASELLANEIIRTLVGSIGLVASVPITTLVAALVASQENLEEVAR